jgi:hypothetical protein
MNYHEELQAKLEAVRISPSAKPAQTRDMLSLEEQLVKALEAELELSQYDLSEGDILRSIKILHALSRYGEAFAHHKALRIFYILAKTDLIQAKNLYRLSNTMSKEFKQIITSMAKCGLITIGEEKMLELSIEGQSLAERIGVDVFI